MNLNYLRGAYLLYIACLFVAFQNCSQTSFSSQSSSAGIDGTGNANGTLTSGGGVSGATGTISQTLNTLQPAMAVRSANCINCHGNTMSSSLITDFAAGDSYFFSKNNASPVSGDWVYSLRLDADSSSSTYIPYWAQSQQYAAGAKIFVPQVDLGFSYANYKPSWAASAAWMGATTLPSLISAIEAMPGAGSTPVVSLSKVFIGAPSASQLRAAGGLDGNHILQFYPNSGTSPALSGLQNTGAYFTNSGILTCDGDLFIDGPLFLNQLTLITQMGCRIHATGPIFVQQGINYGGGSANANLQLVSARLISMGVGSSHCETANSPGWYYNSNVADPLAMRLIRLSDPSATDFKDVRTRNTAQSIGFEQSAASPAAEGQALYAIGKQISALQDASCHGRNVAYSRLLLVAPQLHSRYNGNFSGVIIGEFPLFSLGTFSYTFDPIFLSVPVLPKIPNSQFLKVTP